MILLIEAKATLWLIIIFIKKYLFTQIYFWFGITNAPPYFFSIFLVWYIKDIDLKSVEKNYARGDKQHISRIIYLTEVCIV